MIQSLFTNLTVSHESITSTSEALLEMGKQQPLDIPDIWAQWNTHMTSCSQKDKHLAQLYLVNDVLQKSALQQLPVFQSSIKPYLSTVFQQLYLSTDSKFKSSLNNLIKLWRQRSLFDTNYLDALTQQPCVQELPEQIIHIPKELISFANNLQDLSKWKVKCQEQHVKVSGLVNQKVEIEEVNHELREYKRVLDLQQKYQGNCLRSLVECTKKVDQNHLNSVLVLKSLQTKLGHLQETCQMRI